MFMDADTPKIGITSKKEGADDDARQVQFLYGNCTRRASSGFHKCSLALVAIIV